MLQIKFPSKKCATESWTIQIIKQFHAPSPTPFETGSFENSIDKTTTQNSKKDEALRLSKPAKSNFIQPKDSVLNTKRQHSFHLTPGAGTKEDKHIPRTNTKQTVYERANTKQTVRHVQPVLQTTNEGRGSPKRMISSKIMRMTQTRF